MAIFSSLRCAPAAGRASGSVRAARERRCRTMLSPAGIGIAGRGADNAVAANDEAAAGVGVSRCAVGIGADAASARTDVASAGATGCGRDASSPCRKRASAWMFE